MRQRVSAERRLQPGKASDYIRHAAEYLKAIRLVVLCLRVSGHAQHSAGNLADQAANLRNLAAYYGARVVAEVEYVGPGWDPIWLARAAAIAAEHGAVLLAESADRFIRSAGYSKYNQQPQARHVELEELKRCTNGAILLTDLHPDARPEEARGYQRTRGQLMKENSGGRPPKSEQRMLLDAVIGKARLLPRVGGKG